MKTVVFVSMSATTFIRKKINFHLKNGCHQDISKASPTIE